jgi:hypothetical protein
VCLNGNLFAGGDGRRWPLSKGAWWSVTTFVSLASLRSIKCPRPARGCPVRLLPVNAFYPQCNCVECTVTLSGTEPAIPDQIRTRICSVQRGTVSDIAERFKISTIIATAPLRKAWRHCISALQQQPEPTLSSTTTTTTSHLYNDLSSPPQGL